MKNILFPIYAFVICILFSTQLNAQQDAHYTQFMFNKLSINPGYVVAQDYACASCLHRSQWSGFEGAPTSQSFNLRVPFPKSNVGVGLSINRDVIGPSKSITTNLIYGYRIKFKDGNLGVGLQGSIKNYQVDFSNSNASREGDSAIGMDMSSQTFVNVGAGLYYYTPKYYIGISVPHIIKNDISLISSQLANNSDFTKETLHSFLMTSVIFDISPQVKIKPALLLKYAKNAPFDMDINANLIFFDRFWAGMTYRIGGFQNNGLGESIDLILQYQINNHLRLGAAYDFALSDVRKYSSGTYEILLDYCLAPRNKLLTNPRFF